MTEQPVIPEPHHDEEDVPAALARTTHDGPGETPLEDLPPSDFVSFAESDVEKEDES
jgi:hypothetical protein